MKKENQEGTKDRQAHSKDRALEHQGVRITHTDDSLKAGERGPTLMEVAVILNYWILYSVLCYPAACDGVA